MINDQKETIRQLVNEYLCNSDKKYYYNVECLIKGNEDNGYMGLALDFTREEALYVKQTLLRLWRERNNGTKDISFEDICQRTDLFDCLGADKRLDSLLFDRVDQVLGCKDVVLIDFDAPERFYGMSAVPYDEEKREWSTPHEFEALLCDDEVRCLLENCLERNEHFNINDLIGCNQALAAKLNAQAIWDAHLGNKPFVILFDEVNEIVRTLKSKNVENHRNTPSWDAGKWVEEFQEACRQRETHDVRRKVFVSTLDFVQKGSYVSESGKEVDLRALLTPNPVSAFYSAEQPVLEKEKDCPTYVHVENKDCLDCAHSMLAADPTADVCVLNMASRRTPGGGVITGAGAQEEYLFRCSDYYRFLYPYASNFDPRMYSIQPDPTHRYPLDRNFGGIHSKGVTVFRENEKCGYALIENPWKVNMVAVPAININMGMPSPKVYHAANLNKIRTILRAAYAGGDRRLVLGAFGCGAFGNDPRVIAGFFKEVLDSAEFKNAFREVVFAIIEDHNSNGRNFKAFQSVFGNNK